MTENKLDQFNQQQFINIESFYTSGKGVKTPVWFVQDNGRLYTRTSRDSWKVKRIRHTPHIQVVPCKAQGQPLGEWLPGSAQVLEDLAEEERINQLFKEKYGLQKSMFEMMSKLNGTQYATIEIVI